MSKQREDLLQALEDLIQDAPTEKVEALHKAMKEYGTSFHHTVGGFKGLMKEVWATMEDSTGYVIDMERGE